MSAALAATATHGSHPARRRRLAGWLIAAIRGYQLARAGRPSGCRFLPSCSEYAIGALGAHGTVRGGGLALRRLLRCHPWGGHGVDPVPGVAGVAEADESRPDESRQGVPAPGEEIPCSR